MPLYVPGRRVAIPTPVAGQYAYTISSNGSTTSVVLGNGTLRLLPWLVESRLSIDRIAAEITTIGEAGSKLRLAVLADNGACYPGAVLLDAGQIAGDSATVQELTVSLTVGPGLYWIGGAVQSAPTTQPTVRVNSNWSAPVMTGAGSSLPSAAGTGIGFSQASVTGAISGTFTATVTAVSLAPRVIVRAA